MTNSTMPATVRDAAAAITLKPLAWMPSHPALTVLAYEDERADVHSAAVRTCGRNDEGLFVQYQCACGFETAQRATDLDASADLISHALSTCADCGADKPRDTFPRCSACAF
jgi:hypothetical protein